MTQTDAHTAVAIPDDLFTEGYVAADGFRIRYQEAGQGEPLVSLHGAGGLRLSRAHALLAEQYRVVVFEAPGFGQSPANERSQSMPELAGTMARYRFFFNPIRYTSLGLAVVEAMTAGLPIVALATTELPTVIRNEVNGYIDTRPRRLVDVMKWLLEDPDTARRWGAAARETALSRFGMPRFIAEWDAVLAECCDR